ncbi:hypothetical protein FA95DRAFT_917331 [Auriscalpium vulgare]|uniref:Uncharacterized protein n=1 Tax=Auriscalpium vulgare TaxID=40419 RepID=A0ACB8R7S3_9AGAM|nr:hypothetical protein FA95DRAFT_917331 [Auriscalpium vulgare]
MFMALSELTIGRAVFFYIQAICFSLIHIRRCRTTMPASKTSGTSKYPPAPKVISFAYLWNPYEMKKGVN